MDKGHNFPFRVILSFFLSFKVALACRTNLHSKRHGLTTNSKKFELYGVLRWFYSALCIAAFEGKEPTQENYRQTIFPFYGKIIWKPKDKSVILGCQVRIRNRSLPVQTLFSIFKGRYQTQSLRDSCICRGARVSTYTVFYGLFKSILPSPLRLLLIVILANV